MDKIVRLRQEIERLKKYYAECGYPGMGEYEQGNKQGRLDTLDNILSFLDTLSVEPDKNLEEAAEISFDEADALTEDYMNFLAEGLTENKPRPIGPHWFCEYAKNRFIAGAEWQAEKCDEETSKLLYAERQTAYVYGWDDHKEQMLKDAFVDNYVVHDGRIELEGDPLPCIDPILILPYPQFKPGDKVRIVILKAEEE